MTTFAFTDPGRAHWPRPRKQAEIQQVHSGSAGAIMAEANAARTIAQWERGLPALKLKALLNEI